jgi:hydrogenase expression/formation protein HypE
MRIGKLSDQDLRRLVLDRLPKPSDRTVTGPGTGLDCAVVRGGGDLVVLTCDPITGAEADIGRIAVHVACNDIASSGLTPRYLLLSLVAPPETTPESIANLVDQAASAAESLRVEIVGGHTEISDAVRRFVVNTTAIAFSEGRPVVTSSGGQAGDALLMTRSAGLEGTSILAGDRSASLAHALTALEIAEAKRFVDHISVVSDGIVGGREGAHAMHDATEGGILGAVWELAEASRLGCIIDKASIPVHALTSRICSALSIDPLRLISSGSMLIATDRPTGMIAALATMGVPAVRIGTLTLDPRRILLTEGSETEMQPPGPDELFAAL